MNAIKLFFIYWWYLTKYFIQIHFNKIKHKSNPKLVKIYDAMLFVLLKHHCVRQKYADKYPYFYHLNMVTKFALKFKECVDYDVNCIIAALCHDLIEDCRMTYNDVVDVFGKSVADMVYTCTELRGKTRDERHGPEYYESLQEDMNGRFVKISDVIGNMTFGKMNGGKMLIKYQKNYPKFKQLLYHEKYKPMFDYIEANLL